MPLSDDGWLTPEIGSWGEDKYCLVHTYADLFATSMKRKWDTRVYIDLFAGAGLAVSRSQIRALVRAGVLRPVWLPHQSGVGVINRVLYDIRDLDHFIDNCKIQESDHSSAA